jgi:transposase
VYFIGVDHHKQVSVMTVLEEDGQEWKTGRMPNLRSYVERFLEDCRPFTAVLEAGRSSYVMADLLRDLGGEVKIANALQVKAIAHARIKTDKRDSRTLAHLLRANLIPEVYQRGEWNRRAQRVMRMRAYWVHKQTEVKNKVRALLAQQREDVRLEVEKRESGLFSSKGLEFLAKLPLESKEKEVLEDLLQGYKEIQAHIKKSDGMVDALYGEMEEASRIDTVPGFAKTLSVLVAVEIADVKRFARAADLHSYAGVIPLDALIGREDVSRTHHQAREQMAEMGGFGSGLSGDQERWKW